MKICIASISVVLDVISAGEHQISTAVSTVLRAQEFAYFSVSVTGQPEVATLPRSSDPNCEAVVLEKKGFSSNFILCPAIRPGELTDKVTLQAPTNASARPRLAGNPEKPRTRSSGNCKFYQYAGGRVLGRLPSSHYWLLQVETDANGRSTIRARWHPAAARRCYRLGLPISRFVCSRILKKDPYRPPSC
jgi:hypothetical protein